MRTTSIFLVSFLALVSVALAQEVGSVVTETGIVADDKTITAGMTPDSPFYFIDTALDQIRLLLTFDNTAKAEKGLEIARERLLEVREMVLENKTDAVQKAKNEHVKSLEKVKGSITALSRGNSTRQIIEEIELEKELEEHEKEVEVISDELKIKIKVKGDITPAQQDLIDSVLDLMKDKAGEVKIKIENKKGETKIKIKAETGKTEVEIENEVEELEERAGLLEIKQAKAEEKIDDALEELAEVRSKLLEANITQVNITAVSEMILQTEEKLTKSQEALNEAKFGEAFGLANAAEQLAENAGKILERALEKEEEKKEIEVEIEGGVAKIKVKVNDLKLKYRLNTTDREEIVTDISSKTGLSHDEINSVMEIEVEEEKKEIEVEIEKGVAKVEVEVSGKKLKYVLPTANESEILDDIASKTGLSVEETKSLTKIEKEEEKGEKRPTSSGKSQEKEESESDESEEKNEDEGSESSSGSSESSGSEKSGKSEKED